MRSSVLISNLHCPSCVNTIQSSLASLQLQNLSISILDSSVSYNSTSTASLADVETKLKQAGFIIEEIIETKPKASSKKWYQYESPQARERREEVAREELEKVHLMNCEACRMEGSSSSSIIDRDDTKIKAGALVQTKLMIEGMTCSSCVGSVQRALEAIETSSEVTVSLLPPLATLIHKPEISIDFIISELEDCGFGATLIDSKEVLDKDLNIGREVKLKIEGMFCQKCVKSISRYLDSAGLISCTLLSLESGIIEISYNPSIIKLRNLSAAVSSLGPFTVTVISPKDELNLHARNLQKREFKTLSIRCILAFLLAIPTFTIAMIGMMLLQPDDPFRKYLETPLLGFASRGTLTLCGLATIAQFGVGSMFYSSSYRKIRGVWKSGNVFDRFFRWGSMDTLISLGGSVAYVSSFYFMVKEILGRKAQEMTMTYFDSCVFLVFFILMGRLLEGIARRKTGAAVEKLNQLDSTTGILCDSQTQSQEIIPIDFFEVGDLIHYQVGELVNLDSKIIRNSNSSTLDESSITGESVPVLRNPGDTILNGTMNLGPSSLVAEVIAVHGDSVVDQILLSVREAMAKKTGIEKLADSLTGFFVPAVVAISCLTLTIWLLSGASVSFSLQFAISVLVVSCPCGIGLAAPTAQMVGIGIAASKGILTFSAEAFQTSKSVDVVIFDKTGTLTTGDFAVSDTRIFSSDFNYQVMDLIEAGSSHPISKALRDHAQAQNDSTSSSTIKIISSEEIAGRGLRAKVEIEGELLEILVGNDFFMIENQLSGVNMEEKAKLVSKWSSQGRSIVIVAIKAGNSTSFTIAALFGIVDSPRSEAAFVVKQLQERGIAVFMCSGDNVRTAKAIAQSIGITEDSVFAGVLPEGKLEVVKDLQNGGATKILKRLRKGKLSWTRIFKSRDNFSRATVLFVGDGINDVLSLSQAEVGVSMGSGASIALSSSDFSLLSSNLLSLLTLLDISKSTTKKIFSNFLWACVFNGCLIPLAAGVFYPIKLDPSLASLAMALSSISVVVNSLTLGLWNYDHKLLNEKKKLVEI